MPVNEAAFAARISAIERFTGESPKQFVYKYEKLLGNYLDTADVIGILNGESGYEMLNCLLRRAIDLAGTETDKSEGKRRKGKNLASVFSRLSTSDRQLDRSKFFHYKYEELGPDDVAFPQQRSEETDKEVGNHLINGFYKEMDQLAFEPPRDYHAFIVCFDRISRQYMWCVTASDYEGEDISLYDFMKVTEALMVCLIKCDDKEKPFTLVMGDFSGIQKYIFAISSPNNAGVAKRLRARSFYVDIVNRVYSHYVIDCFEVDIANILLQSGGKFYCIVPTLDNIDERMSGIRDEFDQDLFQKFHGSVSVNFAWLPCTDEDIKNYSDSIVELNNLLGGKKSAPFKGILTKDGKWDTDQFVLYQDLANKHVCEICGMELTDETESSCDMCKKQLEMGTLIPDTKYIVYTKSGGGGGKEVFTIFKNYCIKLLPSNFDDNLKDAYLIEALNNAKIDKVKTLPCTIKYMATHIPTERDTQVPMDFSSIAESSQGMNKLGVLKADVDVLGFLFSQGLRAGERHYGTISRVNTMSRMLELFFCGYVEHKLEKKPYRNVYTVFSGGDDLFLLGPWDVILDLANEVHKKFNEFTAQNKDVTLSASVTVFDAKEHIAFMAESSEEQLERAKKGEQPKIYRGKEVRNSICVMGDIFSWEDFDTQYNNAVNLTDALIEKEKNISTQMLRRIIQYSEMYRRYLISQDGRDLMFEPMFAYDKARNYPQLGKKDPEDIPWFFREYIPALLKIDDGTDVNKDLYFARTMISIALNKTRKERN